MGSSNRNNNSRKVKVWLLAGGIVLLAVLGAIFYGPVRELVWKITGFLMDKEEARRYILSYQPYSALYFIGLQALQVVLSPIPGELSGFLGGFIFGWAFGLIYSTAGLTLGSLAAVSLGRVFERVFLEKIIPARILNEFGVRVHRWGLATVFILFLIPGAPKDYMSYLFGLSPIPIWSFLLVSSMARLPGTLVLSLQGAKVFEGDWTFFALLTVGALTVLIPLLLFKDRILGRLGISGGRTEDP